MSTFPSFYNPNKVGQLYAPDLAAIGAAAASYKHVPPAYEDPENDQTALVLIDTQVDFIHADGALSVPGAIDDTRRTIEFIFNNLHKITQIIASLDTHTKIQIFSPSWWVDKNGNHPKPFTMITHEQVKNGTWTAIYDPEWSLAYTKQLESNAKKTLMIWPYHTLLGTVGHIITPALMEAILFHAAVRQTQPEFITKGTIARVENYSIYEPEVKDDSDEDGGVDKFHLDALSSYKRIYIAGQAKSHCVLESLNSLYNWYHNDPATLNKVHVLTDAMSSVYSPDIDFEAIAQSRFGFFKSKGFNFVKTSDKIA